MPPKSRKIAKNVKNGSKSKKHQEIYYEKTEKSRNREKLWKIAKSSRKENGPTIPSFSLTATCKSL
jgi:hypothetical protein